MKKAVFILLLSVFIITIIIVFTPFGLKRVQAKQASGIVTSVYTTTLKEPVFKISGLNISFILDKTLGKKFSLTEIREKVLGKKVRILYSDSWTPLDPGCKKHVAELSVDEQLIYSELR